MTPIIYLDTNHVSTLARRRSEPASQAVVQLFERGIARLGLSILHLQELSDPAFISRPLVGSMLDALPISWAPFFHVVFDREVNWALETALTGKTVAHQVFNEQFEHAFGAPYNAVIPISEMLEAFASNPELRAKLPQAAQYGVKGDRALKDQAAAVRDPDKPLLSRIRDAQLRRTPSGLYMPVPYPPEEILRRAGGLPGFPAYNVFQGLARTRLADGFFPTTENDLLDEWHACYAPYTAAIALDRRTARRFKGAKLPSVERVTYRLEEIPAILERKEAS